MQQQVRYQKRDPVEEGRQARARAKVVGDGTLEGLVTKYYSTGRGAALRTADEQKARILALQDQTDILSGNLMTLQNTLAQIQLELPQQKAQPN